MSFQIAGIPVHVTGLDQVQDHVDKAIVLYMMHGRTSNHEAAQAVIQDVRSRYQGSTVLLGVTFDAHNHGQRTVDALHNEGWPKSETDTGNEAHALDMLSMVDATARDLDVVLRYLPGYLAAAGHEIKTLVPIVSGVSLGGHEAWRVSLLNPSIAGICPIIGTPQISKLMLQRLGVQLETSHYYQVPYDQLGLNATQQRRWPRALHDHVAQEDLALAEAMPPIPILILTGGDDKLVPSVISEAWVKEQGRDNVEIHVEPGLGHAVSGIMAGHLAKWLERF